MQMSFSITIILAQDIVPHNAAMASGMMLVKLEKTFSN